MSLRLLHPVMHCFSFVVIVCTAWFEIRFNPGKMVGGLGWDGGLGGVHAHAFRTKNAAAVARVSQALL